MTAEQLVSLLESGKKRQAASWLVQTHAHEVLGLCRALVRDEATAEDLTQDTFHRALTALEGFRGDASPRTWLLRIARNRCIDHLRRQARAPYRLDEADEPAVDERTPSASDLLSRRGAVLRALDALEERDRALVILRYRHGLGYAELADAYGAKQGAIRMRVSRALAKMRAALESPVVGAPTPFAQPAAPGAPPTPRTPSAPSPRSPAAPAPRRAPALPGSPAAPGAPPPASPPPPPRPSFADVLAARDPALPGTLRAALDALVAAI